MERVLQHSVAKAISTALAILFLVVIVTSSVVGQTEAGQINGKVFDPNGALVPNASVTVKSVDTGVEATQTTSGDGSYTFAHIKPGLYDVTVTASGFAPATHQVQVTVSSQTSLTTNLSISGGQAQVTVVAGESGIAVNTQNQQVSNVVSSVQLRELPSLTRNPYDFVSLSGSVASDPNGSTGRGAGVAINGQR